MESGLLNAFHDDHYDGNYSSFETENNYWSHGNDTLGLQLSEALEGILPLSPLEEKPIFENETDRRFSFHLEDTSSEQNDSLTESWKQDSSRKQYFGKEYQQHASSPSIEIIAVDPNCDYSSPSSNSEEEDSEVEYCDIEDEDEVAVECSSRASKRTMSSSIADYESHTSDDSDDDSENEVIEENCILYNGLPEQHNTEIPYKLEDHDMLLDPIESGRGPLVGRKSYGLSSLEAEIVDMKNFDLASFITRDDYEFAIQSSIKEGRRILAEEIAKSYEVSNSSVDPEDDIIVDVETVQENDIEFVFDDNVVEIENSELNSSFTTQVEDDPVKDPSWSPTAKNSKTTKFPKSRNRNASKNSISGNNKPLTVNKLEGVVGTKALLNTSKKTVFFDQKRKYFGLGRGKNISMCSKPDLISSFEPDQENLCGIDQGEENKVQKSQEGDKNEIQQTSSKLSVQCEIKETLNNKEVIAKSLSQKYSPQKSLVSVKNPKRAIEVEIRGNELVEVQKKNTCSEIIRNSKINGKEPDNLNCTSSENGALNSAGSKPLCAEIQSELDVPPPKKKLNLEEYKRRREKNISCLGNRPSSPSKAGIAGHAKINGIQVEVYKKPENLKNSSQLSVLKPILPKEEVCQVKIEKVKEISQVKIERQFYDPIIEAKNKVLRLQELKKAARTKLIDSTVSAKVGPVTKILPLEEIVKNSSIAKTSNCKASLKFNPDYEEIIIVSAGCNTDISLSPLENIEEQVKNSNSSSNAFLQSNALLHNISNTLQKAKSSENIKISSNSLISSIQDVVLKKSTPTSQKPNMQNALNSLDVAMSSSDEVSSVKPEISQMKSNNAVVSGEKNFVSEHGEDKIIMHLRKDRIRPKMQTVSVQTNSLPQFPALELIIPIKSSVKNTKTCISKEKRRRRQYRSRRASYSSAESNYRSQTRSREDSLSSQSSRDSAISDKSRRDSRKQKRHHSKSRSRKHSYRSRSRSKSRVEKKRRKRRTTSSNCSECTYRSSSTSCSSRSDSYSSRSSRSRSRSKSRTSYHNSGYRSDKRHYDRHVPPAVEERRIVYVGRIEHDTTKEDLKRKFILYGPIRQVTVHYKDTGMKYGFVTFDRAQDAFTAIDNGARDPKISMYDISFGGRRAFCKSSYADLDGAATTTLQVSSYSSVVKKPVAEESFEDLLKAVKERMRGAKSVGSSRTKT